jgi:hypothetical protein
MDKSTKSNLSFVAFITWFIGWMVYAKSLKDKIPAWKFWVFVVVSALLIVWMLITIANSK